MKCALIATCMLENNYLIEWVEYYKKIGVDKIFLGDNNPINGEHPQEVLQEYIESDFVEIINYNECEGVAQTQTFDDMYNAHKNEYDWFLFFDIDELLWMEHYDNVKDFLNQNKFNNYDAIHIIWKTFGDDNIIEVINNDYSIQNRFTEVVKSGTIEDEQPKCIIRTTKDIIHLEGPHLDIINSHEIMRRCNTEGIALTHLYNYGATIKPRSYKDAYIKHYRTKTLQEYIEHRIRRGVPFDHQVSKTHNINFFFLFNERTPQKEEWLKENYPDYYNQLFEPYFLGDFYTHDWTLDIYNY